MSGSQLLEFGSLLGSNLPSDYYLFTAFDPHSLIAIVQRTLNIVMNIPIRIQRSQLQRQGSGDRGKKTALHKHSEIQDLSP